MDLSGARARPGPETGSAPEPGIVEWRISAGRSPIPRRSPRWRNGSPRSGRARRRSWSGCSSTRRSTPPAPAPASEDLLAPPRFPVFDAGRGGQYTYHGPGQRVAYVMLDLQRRKPDLRRLHLAAGGVGHPHARAVQRARRAARRPHRHLGGRAGRRGGQDRRDRRARAPLGDLPRRRDQPRSRPRALQRHRALRHQRLRRDLVRRRSASPRPWPTWTPRCGGPSRRYLAPLCRLAELARRGSLPRERH